MLTVEEKIKLSRAEKVNVTVAHPKGLTPRDYQIAGAYYSTLQDSTLFADDMGLGKTIQSILGMNERKVKRALIACPSSLAYNWSKEIKIWSTTLKVVEVYDPRSFLGMGDAIIVPYGQLGRKKDAQKIKEILESGEFDCLVLDEVQLLKNPKANRTRLVLAKNGLRSASKVAHLLSGTPFEKEPMEMFNIISAFAPWILPEGMDRFGFGVKYCGGYKMRFGEKTYWKFDGASNQADLNRRLRAGFMVRRKKDQVLKELPPKTVNIVELDPSPNARAVISQMATLDEFKARGGTNAAFEEYSEAWAELGLAKVPYAMDYVETLLSGGWNKILVFAHHIPVAEALRDGFADLGYRTIMATGEMSPKKRGELVEKFQTDPAIRVFVLTIDSMGVGHTLTAASYGVMVEFSTLWSKNLQAEDRMHRIGQGDNVFIDYLVMKKSLDYHRLKQGRKRNKNFEEIMA